MSRFEGRDVDDAMGGVSRDSLLLLARYDRWATARVLAAAARLPAAAWIKPLGSGVACLRDGAVRLVSSALVWLARWQGRPMATGLRATTFPCAEAVQARWEVVADEIQGFLNGVAQAELDAPLTYRTSTGRQRSEILSWTVLHMLAHAAYHRGQTMVAIRQLGGATVHTDLQHYLQRCRQARQ